MAGGDVPDAGPVPAVRRGCPGSTISRAATAYGSYQIPIGSGLTVKAGKFVTLLDYEVIESPNNLNFSLVPLHLRHPLTHVGALLAYEPLSWLAHRRNRRRLRRRARQQQRDGLYWLDRHDSDQVSRLEYRHDSANQKVFSIRAPGYVPTGKTQDTITLALYYSFF
jgi:hypothetical protein